MLATNVMVVVVVAFASSATVGTMLLAGVVKGVVLVHLRVV